MRFAPASGSFNVAERRVNYGKVVELEKPELYDLTADISKNTMYKSSSRGSEATSRPHREA